MTVSKYFNHNKSAPEQNLYEGLVIETIKMSGMDVYYLPATRDAVDEIMGESTKTTFNNIFPIEMYMPSGGATSGDGDIMSKFGFAIRDTTELVVSRKRFKEECDANGLDIFRPQEGDIIFVGDIDEPWNSQLNMIFEITHVSSKDDAWPFGKVFVYTIGLSAYTYSYQTFNTQTPLDATLPSNADELSLAINNAVTNTKATLVRFDKNNPLSNV